MWIHYGQEILEEVPIDFVFFFPGYQAELYSGTPDPVTSDFSLFSISGQNSKGLHTVVLPKDLCKQFLRSARKNTKKGIETCGVLCGTLVKILKFLLELRRFLPFGCPGPSENISRGSVHTYHSTEGKLVKRPELPEFVACIMLLFRDPLQCHVRYFHSSHG